MSAKAAKRRGGKSARGVAAKLRALQCDPITELARLAMDPEIPPPLRARMLIELAQYVAPKKRARAAEKSPAPAGRTHEEWLKLLPA